MLVSYLYISKQNVCCFNVCSLPFTTHLLQEILITLMLDHPLVSGLRRLDKEVPGTGYSAHDETVKSEAAGSSSQQCVN